MRIIKKTLTCHVEIKLNFMEHRKKKQDNTSSEYEYT